MVVKLAKKRIQKWFRFFVLYAVELFKCFLAVFLDIPKLSWTALDPKHLEKNECFLNGFVNAQFFGIREVMLAFLGAYWRSWADSGLKLTKIAPKLIQN